MARTFGEIEPLAEEDPPPSRPTLPWRDDPPWLDPAPSVRGAAIPRAAATPTMRLPSSPREVRGERPARVSTIPPSGETPTARPGQRTSSVPPPSGKVRTHPPPSTRAPQVVAVEEVVLKARDPRVDD